MEKGGICEELNPLWLTKTKQFAMCDVPSKKK